MEYLDQIEKLINVVVFMVRKMSSDTVKQSEIEQSFQKVLQLIQSFNEPVEEFEEKTLKIGSDIQFEILEEEYIQREKEKVEKYHVCPLQECEQSFHSFQDLLKHSQREHNSRIKIDTSAIPIVSQKVSKQSPQKHYTKLEECPLCEVDFLPSKLYSHVLEVLSAFHSVKHFISVLCK